MLQLSSHQGCWYGGIGPGYSYVSPDGEAQNFIHDTNDNHDAGAHVVIGRHLSPHWFVELKYADLGEAGITNRNPAIAAAFPDAAISYRVPSIMAGYQWRVRKYLKPFAKIGVSAVGNSASGGPVPFEEQTSVQLAFGLGLRMDLGRSPWFLRGDVDLYDRDALEAGGKGRAIFQRNDEDDPRVLARQQADSDMRLAVFCKTLTPETLRQTRATDRREGTAQERVDWLLLHLVQHQIHHRGQAHVQLQDAGVAPPQLDDFYLTHGRAPSADLYWS